MSLEVATLASGILSTRKMAPCMFNLLAMIAARSNGYVHEEGEEMLCVEAWIIMEPEESSSQTWMKTLVCVAGRWVRPKILVLFHEA